MLAHTPKHLSIDQIFAFSSLFFYCVLLQSCGHARARTHTHARTQTLAHIFIFFSFGAFCWCLQLRRQGWKRAGVTVQRPRPCHHGNMALGGRENPTSQTFLYPASRGVLSPLKGERELSDFCSWEKLKCSLMLKIKCTLCCYAFMRTHFLWAKCCCHIFRTF